MIKSWPPVGLKLLQFLILLTFMYLVYQLYGVALLGLGRPAEAYDVLGKALSTFEILVPDTDIRIAESWAKTSLTYVLISLIVISVLREMSVCLTKLNQRRKAVEVSREALAMARSALPQKNALPACERGKTGKRIITIVLFLFFSSHLSCAVPIGKEGSNGVSERSSDAAGRVSV